MLSFSFIHATCQRFKKTNHVDSTIIIDSIERQKEYEALVKGTSLEGSSLDKENNVATSHKTIDTLIYGVYYVGTAGANTQLYAAANPLITTLIFQPGQQFIFTKSNADYIPVTFGEKHGYVAKIAILKIHKYGDSKIVTFHPEYGTYDYLPTQNNNTYSENNNGSSNSSNVTISNGYSGIKTVHVSGYTRKDGTNVSSHYRSAPSKH